jgi:hypothetical protein
MNKLLPKTITSITGAIALSLPLGISPAMTQTGTNQCVMEMHQLQQSLETETGNSAPLNLFAVEEFYPNSEFPSPGLLLAVFTIEGDSMEAPLENFNDFLDTCKGIQAVEIRGNRTGFSATYGWVNGEKRWFDCVEAGLNLPPIEWGQQICGL